MEFEEMKVSELREAARHFAPETRGAGGIAHVGSKEQLIELLRQKGVMACEAKEFCDGNGKVEAPKDVPVIPVGGAAQGAAENAEDNGDGKGDEQQTGAVAKDGGQPEDDGFVHLHPMKPQPEQQQSQQPQMPEQPESDDPDELEILRQIITRKVKQGGVDSEAVGKIVDEKLAEFREKFRKETVKVIEIKQGKGLPNKPVGVCHKLTPQIAQVCNLGIHQMLVGPAGGGKTTCCEKVAEILNLKFYPMSVNL